MTQIAPEIPTDNTVTARDLQRESLEQIVRLSMECSAEEQRIEEEHDSAQARQQAAFQKKVAMSAQENQERVEQLAASVAQRQAALERDYKSKLEAAENDNHTNEFRLTRKKEDAESTLKKQLEQTSWEAESLLVAFEMKNDTEEQKSRQELEVKLQELKALQTAVKETMDRYPVEAFAVEAPLDEPLKERIGKEPQAVLAEYRQKSMGLLQELRNVTRPNPMVDFVPFALSVALAGGAGGATWYFSHDAGTRPLFAAGAACAGMLVGIAGWTIYRLRHRAGVRAKAKVVYTSLEQALGIAIHAAQGEFDAVAEARDRRVKEARRKRDVEVNGARDKARGAQIQMAEKYRVVLAEETRRHKSQLAAIELEKQQGEEEVRKYEEETQRQLQQEDGQAREDNQTKQTQALEAIGLKYESACHGLKERWEAGLRGVTDLLSAGNGIDPQLMDWNSAAWNGWKSPEEFSGQVRFGEMKVDLAQLTAQVPKRLKLPESFSVPALLALPVRASLLVEADRSGRAACNNLVQMIMTRLLTQIPAGRVKFTIFDPVGLGQSFAGFMHLADNDESLVGARIWTEKEHMQQRLADLTEHMETVIQKYLRNEYATIDQYNAQAGELAEPFRFLVIADFPSGLEAESLRRLSSIAVTGPRCGVYTIILRDTRQPIPPSARMDEIIARSVHLLYKDGGFVWEDEVFKRFPLRVDAPPDERTLTQLMDLVGKAAKEAKRVEVPFQSIAPPENQFWSMSSKDDVRVPIGKSGATRLQTLRLGVGVAQHVLVAGKTGSGKSNLMHTIITNMAMWYGPDEVEFFLVDFKKGVEFKAYASSGLPHARAIAVESDREFGLSVLQRVDAELTRRGAMFRDVGAQEITTFREKTGQKLPRTILLIDEFQEFFSEDDKLSQEASGLMDRLVRQGRAFGVHLVLGSQTIGGSSGLARSTLGQIAVRVALQCSEADSQIILGDNNSAARLLTRPGEAVYNDAGGLVEANSPFQIAFLPDEQRTRYLEKVSLLAKNQGTTAAAPIVFEGNSAAAIRSNAPLMNLLQRPAYPPAASTVAAYVGEPVAIKAPTAIALRRQSGANVLMVGQQEESAVAMFASMAVSIAAQQKPGDAIFYLLDGTPNDSRSFGLLQRVMEALPQQSKVIGLREVPDAINELATTLLARQGDDTHAGPSVYLLLFALQRYRMLRHQEDNFSFGRDEEAAAPKPDKQLADLLLEGPALGLHTIVWADAPVTLERTLERSSMRQFDFRVLFQMSASDSSNLIDSPSANRLGAHRALLYSEEHGTIEKSRPYQVPDDAWLAFVAERLKGRPAT